jgi:hypothetical protein
MRDFWILVSLGLIILAPAGRAGAQTSAGAVWKEQQFKFFYMGRTSRYSCEGLTDKVRALLISLGARRDLRIAAVGCEDAAARVRLQSLGPTLHIVFSAPALQDPAAKPLHAGDLGAVEARFQSFTLTNDAFRNMDAADCELVEQFAQEILPKLTTRHLKQDIACVPYQRSGGRFLLQGEILKAVQPR